jgi:CPA2 family monovalent cation:H+ antiporter-2
MYMSGTRGMALYLESLFSDAWGEVMTALITCGLMAPLINIMCSTKSVLHIKIWLKHQSNRLPLLALRGMRIIISCFFIALTLRKLLDLPTVPLILFAMLAVGFIIQSDYIKGRTLKMEMRFMENFNEQTLKLQKRQRGIKGEHHWLNESFFVVEFEVLETIKANKVHEFSRSRFLHLTIVKVIRDGKHIIMPGGSYRVLAGDVVHILGTKDEVEAFLLRMEKKHYIQEPKEPMVTLKEYTHKEVLNKIEPELQIICCPIKVEKGLPLVKKSIKSSAFQTLYRAYIVGIERGSLPIVNPDIDTIIEEGDLLWVVGSQRMASNLLKADFLTEPEG